MKGWYGRTWMVVLTVCLGACSVDPMNERAIPFVGVTYSGLLPQQSDAHTEDVGNPDSTEDVRRLDSIDPGKGTPAGADVVLLDGAGFDAGVRVLFGQTEARSVFLVNSRRLRVETPALSLGLVDVSVLWTDGVMRTLPSAFLVFSTLSVDGVVPDRGPIAGGTPISIKGSGFTGDTRLVVGTRLAIGIRVVDEYTMTAVSPPGGTGGAVDVLVSNIGGVAVGKNAFTYTLFPVPTYVFPSVGPPQGGNVVEVRGRQLGTVTDVFWGGEPAQILTVGNGAVSVVVPPGSAGLVDIRVKGQWGWGKLDNAYLYALREELEGETIRVFPHRGTAVGGDLVSIVGCEATDQPEQVWFGDAEAVVEQVAPEDCVMVVRTPPGTGQVDVSVLRSSGAKSLAPAAFTYVEGPEVESLKPNFGGVQGGTSVTLTGSGFQEGMEVLFGPLPATGLQFVSEAEVRVKTPPGSPGTVDVQVVTTEGTARNRGAFLYTVPQPEIYAVSPHYGSRAGGTFIEVLGAGFGPGTQLLVGTGAADKVRAVSYGVLEAKTPPHPPGTVRVLASTSSGTAQLDNAYTFFDPASDYGGTWGSPVDGALNVTVLDAMTWKGLEGATAIIGADPNTPYKGVTDIFGQVTLSGRGLKGPLDVHVTKPAHDACSIVSFDAENVTVYLIPRNPTGSGGGDPPVQLDPGSVTGRVQGLSKYVLVPTGTCRTRAGKPSKQCAACLDQTDCPSGLSCEVFEKDGRYCLLPCVPGDSESCEEGYACAPLQGRGDFCVPMLGARTTRCEISRTSIYDTVYSLTEGQILGPEQRFDIATRLGEVAVICFGGWTDYDTGEFHPTAMGVRRHVNVIPGARVEDLDMELSIPLSRRLRLRMDSPPVFSPYGGTYEVNAHLELGSDGYVRLPGRFVGYDPLDVVLERMPAELSGPLYDATYVFNAGAYTASMTRSPYSVVLYTGIDTLHEGAAAHSVGADGFRTHPGGPDMGLFSVVSLPGEAIIVGENGTLFRYVDGTFTRLPSPTNRHLRDVTRTGGTDLVAVGDDGTLISRMGGVWSLVGSVTDRRLNAVAGRDDGLVAAVGHHRLVVGSGQEFEVGHTGYRLNDVVFDESGVAWAVGDQGAVLRFTGHSWVREYTPIFEDLMAALVDHSGALVVVGDGCIYTNAAGYWQPLLQNAGYRFARAVQKAGNALFLVDTTGRLFQWDPLWGLEELETPSHIMVRDVAEVSANEVLVTGVPAFLLTPFVPFPVFASPTPAGTLSNLQLSWRYEGDDSVIDLHTISLSEAVGHTIWRLTVDGPVRQVLLPDWRLVTGSNPLGTGDKRLRVYSAHYPQFSINRFSLGDLSSSSWRSWAYDMVSFR